MEQQTIHEKYMYALAEVPNFTTDETASAGSRTYKYLNLATLLKTVKPIFLQHGLCLIQQVRFTPFGDGKGMQVGTVDTICFDSEGSQLELGSYPFVVTGDPQAAGSAVTYARRYSLYAALGIFPDKDDDGAAARDYYRQPEPQAGGISKAEAETLSTLAKQHGKNLMALASQLKGRQITKLRELTSDDGAKLTKMILEG